MQKRGKIKWRKSDEQELAKAVRKFNAKRTRLINKFPEMEDFLPERLSVKDIKGDITTRNEFKNQLKSIERFMRKGAEKPIITETGIKTTAYEKKEVGIKVRAINVRKAHERKKADVSTEKGTMGTIKANNLLPKHYNIDKIDKSSWDKFKKGVEKQSKEDYWSGKSEKYKQNYLSVIKDILGIIGKDLYDYVESLDSDFIYEKYYDVTGVQTCALPISVSIAEEALNHWKQATGEL